MARDGYKIFDADTHIIEPVELIEAQLSSKTKDRLKELGPLVRRMPNKGGVSRYLVGTRPALNRRLGTREHIEAPRPAEQGIKGVPWNVKWKGPPFPDERVDFDPVARIRDMDIEGVDINVVLPSGGIPAFCSVDDVNIELAMYEAFHRFMETYCAPYPDRLKGAVLVSGRDINKSVAEIHRCGKQRWPVGIFPICPEGMSLDDPNWELIWAAAESYDLTVVIHSFTIASPYPPGMNDNWDNLFLQRAAGHVWNAQRNMAALIGAGVLDRYPGLRVAALECGHGWLACWGARLDEAADMCKHLIQPLKLRPSEYIKGPQYFQSIQMHEGERSLHHAMEAIGEGTLMFATDYPHTESWFPKSVEILLGWGSLSDSMKNKLFWENATQCYRRVLIP